MIRMFGFDQFASAINELSAIIGYTVIIASVVFTSLSIAKAYFNRNKSTI